MQQTPHVRDSIIAITNQLRLTGKLIDPDHRAVANTELIAAAPMLLENCFTAKILLYNDVK